MGNPLNLGCSSLI